MTSAHLSIHDVAPETMDLVREMIERLATVTDSKVMLLVIPGLDWQPSEIQQLRTWAEEGHLLAGHGWVHKVKHRKTLYHKLHGVFLSRYVAEHLSLNREELLDLLNRNYAWFAAHDLPSPTHYVPPAWALGSLNRADLKTLPFLTVETLEGIYYCPEETFQSMGLLGYEADTLFRTGFLKVFNAWNRKRSNENNPLRIALHPYDLSYNLEKDILMDCHHFTCRASLG